VRKTVSNINDDMLYGRTAAARFVGCSESAIIHWANVGKLPCLRDSGNKRLYRRSDLETCKRSYADYRVSNAIAIRQRWGAEDARNAY
jgi:hypothetical protein